MALVSPSLSGGNGLPYGSNAPAFSRSSSDPAQQIRALPTVPNGAARRQGSQNSLAAPGAGSPGQGLRPLPSPSGRSPSAPPFVELAAARSISPLPPPTHQRSTPPSHSAAPPSSGHYSHHQHSASSSSSASLPRLSPVHLGQGPSSAPPVGYSHHSQLQSSPHQHPSFVGHHPQFPSFGGASSGPHAFPHPGYPFIPSPHPNAGGAGAALGYQPGMYSPGFNVPGGPNPSGNSNAESQHQARLVQQAQLQQQHWQMEMMRQQHQQQQSQAGNWQQDQGQNRRRATSGPAPASHSPQYYTSALPYPPSPSPTLHTKYLPNVGPVPSLPSGAMVPQFGHGYPTPPGSVEGRENGREGYHPYRRGGAKGGDGDGRSSSHSRAAGSSAMTHTHSASSSSSQHYRNDSATSALAASNFPPLPSSAKPSPVASTSSASSVYTGASSMKNTNSSSTSVNSSAGRSSARSTPPPPAATALPPASRSRTESQQSSHSSTTSRDPHVRQHSNSSGSSSVRGDSFDSTRSGTPVQGPNGKKPSPLSRQYQHGVAASLASSSRTSVEADRPGTPGTLRAGRDEEDEDSDDTAGATIGPNSAHALRPTVSAGAGGKEKEKKGMKSRFKKAFGVSSTPALSEKELDGRGPKVAERQRVDSSGSESTAARAPLGSIDSHPRLTSSAASTMTGASMAGSTRPPPSTSGRRFGLLSKANGSTDNLSISSTVSSASVMIRKLGQMGKLARRNSMMSLTKAFKSKDKEEQDPSAPTKDELKQLKKDKKKGVPVSASVSHATAEIESSSSLSGMSPAAALARKHQQQYAEQEAAAAAAAALIEAERQKRAQQSFTVHARDTSDASSIRSGKLLNGEKDKTKKSKGRKWGFGGKKDATADDASSIGDDSSIREPYSRSTSAAGYYEDAPASNVEVLARPHYASYQVGDAGQESAGEEYESRGIENGHRRQHKGVRGILKGAGSYRQEDYAMPKPNFPRTRAASFDAPSQQGRPGSPGNAALVNVIPSEAQVDGLVHPSTSPRADTQPPNSKTTPLDRVPPPSSTAAGTSPYGHPTHNASAPTLSHFGAKLQPVRSASAPTGRRIVFAQNLSVHTTWPANVYDRRAEPATCNRLTPTLAQQIKEELNSFKMEEMDVHPSSRQLTHFFV